MDRDLQCEVDQSAEAEKVALWPCARPASAESGEAFQPAQQRGAAERGQGRSAGTLIEAGRGDDRAIGEDAVWSG